MVEPIFTRAELETFQLWQLKRLASYYQIEYNKTTKKSNLVEQLFQRIGRAESEPGVEVDPDTGEVLPPMSARVRRIYQWKKEHPNG